MNGFNNIIPMSSPPPLVSVASPENHMHYLSHLHQQHLPDVCVPVSVVTSQTPNLPQNQLSSLGLRQTLGCNQTIVLSPAASPTRIDSYSIPLMSGSNITEVETMSTKQLTNNQYLN